MKYFTAFVLGMGEGAILLDLYKAKQELKKSHTYATIKKINVV